jgi:S-adenosylmethionine synthetase
VDDAALEAAIAKVAEASLGGLTPRGIRTGLGLNKPIYQPSAAYGHFGRQAEGDFFPWERTDLAGALKDAVGVSAEAVA